MKNIGSTLLLFGIGSIVLNFFDYEFSLLSWIDNWGITVGWGIRIAMIVIGAAAGSSMDKGEDEEAPE